MIRDTVIASYRVTKSIRKTASDTGVSEHSVRKILITAGMFTSPLVERIKELEAAGMPRHDIAAHLKISKSCVDANTPYSKGTYLDQNKSQNAIRIAKCREQKRVDK